MGRKMKLSISIMMHPSRLKYKDYLLSKLGDVPVILDRGLGIWDTSKRSWLSFDKTADYHCVIQDDAIIGKDFYKNVEKEILAHPNKAFSFYLGNREAFRKDSDKWIADGGVERDIVNWGVAVCLPTAIIEDCMKYGDRLTEYDKHDDTKISKYLQKIRMKVWHPMPSLVDHRWDERSLMERTLANKMRKALYFIGE